MKVYNNKENKNGFTLVELLAVIVILGIIMVIAYASVNQVIKTARKKSFKTSVQMLQKEISNRIEMANMQGEEPDIAMIIL